MLKCLTPRPPLPPLKKQEKTIPISTLMRPPRLSPLLYLLDPSDPSLVVPGQAPKLQS